MDPLHGMEKRGSVSVVNKMTKKNVAKSNRGKSETK